MKNRDKAILRVRLNELIRWRRSICDEFEKWGTHYSKEWFIEQMKLFKEKRYELI